MYKSLLIIFLTCVVCIYTRTTENFKTDLRQAYASWYNCDNCTCHYHNVITFEYTSQNSLSVTPPFNFFHAHNTENSCTSTFTSDVISIIDIDVGLNVARSGRYAELLTPNLTNSAGQILKFNLTLDGTNSNKTSDCDCKDIIILGDNFLKIRSKGKFSVAKLTGTITIDGITENVSENSYADITSLGTKAVTLSRK